MYAPSLKVRVLVASSKVPPVIVLGLTMVIAVPGNKFHLKQGSIPVGCVMPACQPYVSVVVGVGSVRPQVNKFEQVSTDDHLMSPDVTGEYGMSGGGVCPGSIPYHVT